VWVLWWATVTGFVLQEMSARLGLVTGRDLAQAVRDEYPRWLSLVVYVMMEIAVIGADVQEVVASGIAFNLLSHGSIPVWAGCLITAVDTITFLAVGYLGVRYLEGFVCVLMGIMSLCFFINLGHSGLEAWDGVIEGWVIPTMPTGAFTQVVGTIGAVIMPHNLYLHSGLVLSRKLERSSDYRVHEALWYSRVESAGALLFAFLVNLAVVVTGRTRKSTGRCLRSRPCAPGWVRRAAATIFAA
jgi:natural resistance-associated macrophage protein 2